MAEKRKTKRALQAEETKNRIVQATMHLMEKKGFNNITIGEINELSGVSVGTFYHYFTNKEDVFFELYRKADEFFEQIVEKHLYSEVIPAQEMVVRFFSWYARFNNQNGLDYVRQLYNPNNKFFISKGRYMVKLLTRIIEEGVQAGELAVDPSPFEISRHLIILARGIIFDWCLHEGEFDLEEFMTSYLRKVVPIFLSK
jgi:AcrR family transcriptional regulator